MNIWTDRATLAANASGPAWTRLLTDADKPAGSCYISDQDSTDDVRTLANALAYVVTDYVGYRDEAIGRLERAAGTERSAHWLAVGRNLGSYIIAADLLREHLSLGLHKWLASLYDLTLLNDTPENAKGDARGWYPFFSGSNASAQEAFALAALYAYHDCRAGLDWVWERFRVYVGELPGTINLAQGVKLGWAHDSTAPTAIAPRDCYRDGRMLDGAIINDICRGGEYQWPPVHTNYPWIGLEGLVPCAVILERAGYPAFAAGDEAILRAMDYLWYLRCSTGDVRWFDGERGAPIIHLVNQAYQLDRSFPVRSPVGDGRTVGWTDVTHPREERTTP